MQLYTIRRFYEDGRNPRTMAKDLTERQALEWCNGPETSSRTAKGKRRGCSCEWFDGFIKQ